MSVDSNLKELGHRIEKEQTLIEACFAEFARRVVGQRLMAERLMIGLVSGGHILLEGVPGLAKTLAMRTLADIANIDRKSVV